MASFGHSRQQLEKRIGHTSQLGGLKPYTLSEGAATGIRAVDFRTTRGLEFTVLLDRAMDISEARYKGMSLCYRCPSGDVAPSRYDPRGLEWLWTFLGGLLTTCGLTQVGPPHADGAEDLGLHGRVSTASAERVGLSEKWEKDALRLEVTGVVREARLFGPNLEMRRTISARCDCAGFAVRDVFANVGARPAPLMVLYHMNAGFPLLDERTELVVPSVSVQPRDAEAEKGKEKWADMHAPVTGYAEKVYFHKMKAAPDGMVTCALINRRLGSGLGLRLRYKLAELPFFTEWKMLGDREYVLGMEPGNCKPIGRAAARAASELVELPVGGEVEMGFELDVVEGEEALDQLKREASGE
jgi:hypothetical protein